MPEAFNRNWEVEASFWVAPNDFVYKPNAELFTGATDLNKIYVLLLYYAQLILFSNELGPVNTPEMLYCFVSIFISALFQAMIFGDISNIWDDYSKESTAWQQKLDAANEIMSLIRLTDDL